MTNDSKYADCTYEQLVKNIGSLVNKSGYKQKYIAQIAGFDEKDFSNMLNNRKVIKAEYIPYIAKALGITPNVIYGLKDDDQKAG